MSLKQVRRAGTEWQNEERTDRRETQRETASLSVLSVQLATLHRLCIMHAGGKRERHESLQLRRSMHGSEWSLVNWKLWKQARLVPKDQKTEDRVQTDIEH